jgi:hypothetical protein
MQSKSFVGIVSVGVLGMIATAAFGQDAIWEHQQHIQAQQAEQSRIMEMGADQACCGGGGGSHQDENAARFNYYPPEAWDDWVRHGQKAAAEAEQERRSRDPRYRTLAEGTWTFDNKLMKDGTKICAATFWTLRGGVLLIHWGGKEDTTLLGYFGAAIPNPAKPRIVSLALTQSGETQRVRAINMHFPPAKQMGIALFTVPSASALVSSIDDKQDFRVEVGGQIIIQGAWHSGLKARASLSSCLRS